jgi:hypothetical protein
MPNIARMKIGVLREILTELLLRLPKTINVVPRNGKCILYTSRFSSINQRAPVDSQRTSGLTLSED